MDAYRVNARRSTALVGGARSTFYYTPDPRDDRAERTRIVEIAETRPRFRMERVHTLLRREGWRINHKKTRWFTGNKG